MASITKRGNTFRIRVFLGQDALGKQIVKSTTFVPPQGTTEKKAEKLAQEFAFDYERHCRGYMQLNENMRFSELAEWYFDNYAPVELKASTAYSYKGQYKNHIQPILGNTRVKDINPPKLTQIMQSFKLNPETVRKIYVVIQSIFRRGVEQGFLRESPCHDVILPKKQRKKKILALDESQAKRFIDFLNKIEWDEDIKRILKVLLYTGLRAGECLALSWDDIDFENREIHINNTLTYTNDGTFLTPPKTIDSERIIGMSVELASIFKAQKDYTDILKTALGSNYAHPEMVFPSARVNYRDRNALLKSLKRITKGTEFEHLTLHQLRHANATLLLNSGVDLKIVSEHLGHCDIGVTANIYADVLKSTKARVADLITLKLA